MKYLIIFGLFISAISSLLAQNIFVEYDCSPILLTAENRVMIAAANPNFLKKLDNEYERFELSVNANQSKYSFVRLMYKDTSIPIAESRRVYAHVYLDFTHKYIYNVNDAVAEKVGRDTLLIPQDWQIIDENQSIAGYLCKKATRKTAIGHEIVAWFTTEIPMNHGPNTLYGLPGLILAASSKDYTIVAHKVQKLSKPIQLKMPIANEYMALQALKEAGIIAIRSAFNLKKK